MLDKRELLSLLLYFIFDCESLIFCNQFRSNYAAAKGGVISMGRSMAREFVPRGITVNTVCPGFIVSDMTDELSDAVKVSFVSKVY